MAFIKLNMQTELALLSHGKRTHAPAALIADWALTQVRGGLPAPPASNDELRWLNSLYRLEDRRG